MIELAYQLSSEWIAESAQFDFGGADPAVLQYYAFYGDQIFVVDRADLSVRWDPIPILDFAAALVYISRGLRAGEEQVAFEFTESEAKIHFNRRGTDVRISATYTGAVGETSLAELEEAASLYARRVLEDAISLYPKLASNAALKKWYPVGLE